MKSLNVLLSGCAALLLFCGCEKPPVVEAADKPYRKEVEERAAHHKGKASAKATPRPRKTPVRVEYTPRPTPTPDPNSLPVEIVVRASDFNYKQNGEPDGDGWKLKANGIAVVKPLVIPTTMTQILVEAKGEVARDIWPEVLVHMDVITTGVANQPFREDYITSSGYVPIAKPITPALAPGEYTLTFRYLNNQEFPDTKEDRNVTIRQITFRDKDPDAEPEEEKPFVLRPSRRD